MHNHELSAQYSRIPHQHRWPLGKCYNVAVAVMIDFTEDRLLAFTMALDSACSVDTRFASRNALQSAPVTRVAINTHTTVHADLYP